MLEKTMKVFLLSMFILSIHVINSETISAATKVMWGKTELKLGQIGKVTLLSDSDLLKFEEDGSISVVRSIKKGEEYRVYSYKGQQNGLYGVGGGNFIPKNEKILYETPSRNKLAQLISAQQQPASKPESKSKPAMENGLEVIPGAPTSFRNCTEMKNYYPEGVQEGHPAYASKHDRDKDGWACER